MEKKFLPVTDNNRDFPGTGSRMKMQTEGLYFINVQKSPSEDCMSKINERMRNENNKFR